MGVPWKWSNEHAQPSENNFVSPSMDKIYWLNILFRGGTQSSNDEYISTFKQNNLDAFNVPILEFSFKNLNSLKSLLEDLQQETDKNANGLIVTSPRVVEGINSTLQTISADVKVDIIRRINERFVFVVGEKSGKEVTDKLKLGYNHDSINTGSGLALAHYIRTFHDNHLSADELNLIYPKGTLSDETIEDTLSECPRIKLSPVIIYETNVNSRIKSDIDELLRDLSIPGDTTKAMIIHTFFSPSGVDAFSSQIDSIWYKNLVKKYMPKMDVHLCYSAIGKTTEAALIRNHFEVFSVADKPNPSCLLTSFKDKMIHM